MRTIRHAWIMIKKTFRNYLLLSVTALLSFSIMFLYLMFMDSNIYNKYREISGADSNIILSVNSYSYETMRSMEMVSMQLDKLPDSHYYYIHHTLGINNYGGQPCEIAILPNYVWGMFDVGHGGENEEFTIVSRIKLNEKYEFSLKNDEAVISKALYDYLNTEYATAEKKINLVFENREGEEFLRSYRVVGAYVTEGEEYRNPEETTTGDRIYIADPYITQNCDISNVTMVVRTGSVEAVNEEMIKMGLASINTHSEKINAINEKNLVIQNKYIIAAVLFILLGINLYSSFVNALNDRKFEIGVKRALGASKFNIMSQFMVEGLVVMFINIILSILVGTAVMTTYKFARFKLEDYIYVVTMSKESIILYLVFSFFLAITFSLVFAYKSTCVEIVKYLKEETH